MNKTIYDLICDARHIYICGNGGSAANAIHWANDLVACGFAAHALCADISVITAIANDHGYQHVFSRQLQVYGSTRDLLIALSGSGNSRNVIRAINKAKALGMATAVVTGLFGERPSRAEQIAGLSVTRGTDMQRAEEEQLRVLHHFISSRRS